MFCCSSPCCCRRAPLLIVVCCGIDYAGDTDTSSLPQGVMEYVKKNYKENEVKEATKITDENDTITYEVEVKGLDLIFDSKGNFIKSIKA